MFKLFFKKKGCLHGKNQEEKNEFFKSLVEFNESDRAFFEQQHNDLLPHEQKEFLEWAKKGNENLKILKAGLDLLEELLEQKHSKPK